MSDPEDLTRLGKSTFNFDCLHNMIMVMLFDLMVRFPGPFFKYIH